MRALAVLFALAAGCGDDDGHGDADSDTDVDVDADSDTDSDTTTHVEECSGLAEESAANIALEDDLIALVNETRAAGATCGGTAIDPQPPLEVSQEIRCASRAHAQQMATGGAIVATDAADYDSRFRSYGYFGTYFSGTATEDAATAADAMDDWMPLSGSCRLIMNDRPDDFGVGTAQGYWSIGFGSTNP